MFHTREQLVKWLSNHAPRACIKRAIAEGNVELFGGFSCIPPDGRPGWIFEITTAHNKIFNVAVSVHGINRYNAFVIDEVPWGEWMGYNATPLNGDKPDIYQERKNASNSNINKNKTD